MQLSTNLPCGQSGVEYVNQHPDPLPPNVSKEADAAFMDELSRTDERRYRRLVPDSGTTEHRKVGTCSQCGAAILDMPFLSSTRDGKFCTRICRDNDPAKPLRKRGRPRGSKDRSFIVRPNKKYADDAEKEREYRRRKAVTE
jgi:hypothetical protein